MPEWVTKYWVEWAFGIIAAILVGLYRNMSKRIKQNREEGAALRNGMRALLKRQIIEDCEQAQRVGFCSATKKDMILDMYNCYHALGGNDVVTEMKNLMLKLPTEKLGGE